MAGKRDCSLTVCGLPVDVEFKRMRSIRVRLNERTGRFCASAPFGTPVSAVEELVEDNATQLQQIYDRFWSSPKSAHITATPAQKKAWRASLEEQVPALIGKWEPVLGVHAGPVAYREMISRWGSCKRSTGRICINTMLALYPPECLEFVVVHELCHLLQPNHGPAFYQLMDRFLPDWKRRKFLLR